jgi:hypothetical protein
MTAHLTWYKQLQVPFSCNINKGKKGDDLKKSYTANKKISQMVIRLTPH